MKLFNHIIIAIALLFSVNAYSQNLTTSVQGVLRDNLGHSVENGQYALTFKLYSQDVGGTAVWIETQSAEITHGVFSIELGAVTSLPTLDAGTNYYLGISADGGAEMQPRTKLQKAFAANITASLSGSSNIVPSSGNVGIGTKTPSNKLEVVGDIKTTGSIKFNDGTSFSSSTGLSASGVLGTSNIFPSSGNVGIGTTNPTSQLLINETANINTFVSLNNSNTNNPYVGLQLQRSGVEKAFVGLDVDNLVVRTNNMNRLLVRNDGDVLMLGSLYVTKILDYNTSYWIDPDSETRLHNLRILGSQSYGVGSFSFLGYNGGLYTGASGGGTQNYAVYVGANIAASGYHAFSDKRLKNVIGISDSKNDLSLLKKIEITDYTMKDVVTNGNNVHTKVIAQQVQEVLPNAVSKSTGILPTIYEHSTQTKWDNSTNELQITTSKAHEFKEGDEVRIIVEEEKGKENSKDIKVKSIIDEHTFVISSERNYDKVFVFGKYSDDVLLVDYEAIAMLNVSATQELAKQLEAMQKENAELKASLSEAKQNTNNELLAMKEKVAQLEAIIRSLGLLNKTNSSLSKGTK